MVAKHFKSIFTVLSLIIAVGHLIPSLMGWTPSFLLEEIPTQRVTEQATEETEDVEEIEIDVNALSLLDSALKPSKKRKDWRRKIPQWNLHRGEPFLLQVHKAIHTLNTNKCFVTSTRESKLSNFVIIDYNCPNKTLKSIRLELGDQYQDNSSKLAVIFQVDSTSIPILNALNSFNHPLNIMFNPLHKNKQISKDIGRIAKTTKIPQGALEPKSYSSYMHGKVIRIFYSQSKISNYLEPILQDNKWIQFRHGSLARNNPQLLDRLFTVLKKSGVSLIDTQKQFQKNIRDKCVEHQLRCFFPNKINSKKPTVEQLETAMYRARKTGKNILVLEANEENFKIVLENLKRIQQQGTQLVSLDAI